MAASGSNAATGDLVVDNLISGCGKVSTFGKPVGVHFDYRTLHNCRKAGVGLKSHEAISRRSVLAGYHVTRRSGSCRLLLGPSVSNSSSPCYSHGAVPDVSFHGSVFDGQLADSAVSADKNILVDTTLKLQSGSCYLPHPDKEKTGGEDAHFICEDEHVIGIADGVGGWADVGVNAGVYARELMSNSFAAIQDEPKGSIDPARVLEKAHSITKSKGSSTACIIALTHQSLHAVNLGDSGFSIVREGCTIFQSPVQQHGFNFPYQLASGSEGDQPSCGQVFTVAVVPGDIIIAGTDGLFDNLFSKEIDTVVGDGMRAGLEPRVIAQTIAALARQRALDRSRQTPFSSAAQDAGFRYFGGKLDDTTVVVSFITSSATIGQVETES
ncbi:probable protein phosphatase 2C 55 isoform X2 [Rhododendron vialii]|uniref:probable protein phosphatase 2C 55 isoform X2 n=1 Tax=Rhododendron vialii TaxID=182163 RepID=UPI00265F630D|nr:probable protein phosphatase 2C 55 isoform X2 [Rhododendron vialii]